MGLVDDIRRHVFYHYIKPAIDEGRKSITLRAGVIHSELNLRNRVPAVCNALGSNKSIEIYNKWLRDLGYSIRIKLSAIKTPPSGMGANSYYTYSFIHEKIDEGNSLVRATQPYTQGTKSSGDTCGYEEITEDVAREIMSLELGVPLHKEKIDIYGKPKEFDLVNVRHRIVGDFKRFSYKGHAEAEMSNLAEYVWLMEKLEKYTGDKWRKIIVGAGNEKTFRNFARRYNPWLEDVEIYFITPRRKVVRIR